MYVTAHSPSLPSLYLHHSSFSNSFVASPTSQLILQPFFRFLYVTGSSLTSPGELPMVFVYFNCLIMEKFVHDSKASRQWLKLWRDFINSYIILYIHDIRMVNLLSKIFTQFFGKYNGNMTFKVTIVNFSKVVFICLISDILKWVQDLHSILCLLWNSTQNCHMALLDSAYLKESGLLFHLIKILM